ncbi:hypothetical protein ACFSO7_01335 [Bacillus sp. CGMCC 1.16607]
MPKDEHYQLFELPMNTFFGQLKNNKVISELGRLNHEHFTPEDEN